MFTYFQVSDTKIRTRGIEDLKDFEEMASKHKTSLKSSKLESKIDLFKFKHDWETLEKEVLAEKASLNLSGSDFSQNVEKHFINLENILEGIIKQVNSNNRDLSKSVRMLEFEETKLKSKVGKRESSSVHLNFESSVIWLTLSPSLKLFRLSSLLLQKFTAII